MPAVQSRFIHELPEELVSGKTGIAGGYSEKIYSEPAESSTSSSDEFVIGDHVEHKLFGKGKVVAVEGEGDTAKLTILFSGNVRKKLIAKYAKLIHLQI
jgi:DNA helicase-2/ATP-dependent DNA helicase PcrA